MIHFSFKIADFRFKMVGFTLKITDFSFKIDDFSFIMVGFRLKIADFSLQTASQVGPKGRSLPPQGPRTILCHGNAILRRQNAFGILESFKNATRSFKRGHPLKQGGASSQAERGGILPSGTGGHPPKQGGGIIPSRGGILNVCGNLKLEGAGGCFLSLLKK